MKKVLLMLKKDTRQTKISRKCMLVTGLFLITLPPRFNYGFSDYKAGYAPIAKITNNGTRLICYNQTVPQMYSIALSGGNSIQINKSIWNEKVSGLVEKKYCYELKVEKGLKDSIYHIMLQNLNDKFPDIKASIVKVSKANYLRLEKKEEGIIVSPIEKDNTY